MDATSAGTEARAQTTPAWPSPLKRLVAGSVLYLAWASFATAVAIAQDLPSDFAGMSTGLTPARDWAYGFGTALSPPLPWMVIQAALTVLATRHGRTGRVGVGGITIIGLTNTIAGASEPLTYEVLAPATFDTLKAIVQVGMIVLSFMMLVFGIVEWRRRARAEAVGTRPG